MIVKVLSNPHTLGGGVRKTGAAFPPPFAHALPSGKVEQKMKGKHNKFFHARMEPGRGCPVRYAQLTLADDGFLVRRSTEAEVCNKTPRQLWFIRIPPELQ
jgi:hypothetical protein